MRLPTDKIARGAVATQLSTPLRRQAATSASPASGGAFFLFAIHCSSPTLMQQWGSGL